MVVGAVPGSGAVVVGLGAGDSPGLDGVVVVGDGNGAAVVVGDGAPTDGIVVVVGEGFGLGDGDGVSGFAGAAVVVGEPGSGDGATVVVGVSGSGAVPESDTNVYAPGTVSTTSEPGGTRAMSTTPGFARSGVSTSIVKGLVATTTPGCSPNQT